MRNLKAFGLMLVAAFALSAVIASTASAEFTIGVETETSVSEAESSAIEEQVFEANGSTVKCKGVAADGTATGKTVTQVTVEPTYKECTLTVEGIEGILTGQVDSNGCHYLFTTETENAVHILCPAEKQIEVTAKILGTFRKCLDVHAQTPTSPVVHYTNKLNTVTNKWDIELNPTVAGITYEKTGACAFGKLEGNDATYKGKVTVTAIDAITKNPVDLTHSLAGL